MAAHILRILSEIEQGKVPVDQVKYAAGHAAAFDSLDSEEWERLYHACDSAPETLPAIAREFIPRYVAEYFRLDCPRTFEEWNARKYDKAREERKARLAKAVGEAIKKAIDLSKTNPEEFRQRFGRLGKNAAE